MYIAMPKPGRANIRIEDDLKAEANILAEMHRWDLSTLIRTLLNERIEAAKKNTPAAFADAAKRLENAVAVSPGTRAPRQTNSCISCGKLARGGLCERCRKDLIKSPKLAQEKLDDLPYGAIQLNEEGTIIAYNKAETEMSRISHRQAIGKNFFTLAPCADIQEFHGRYDAFLRGKKPSEQFNFTYKFPHGSVSLTITFTRLNSRLALVTAQKIVKAAQRKRA